MLRLCRKKERKEEKGMKIRKREKEFYSETRQKSNKFRLHFIQYMY